MQENQKGPATLGSVENQNTDLNEWKNLASKELRGENLDQLNRQSPEGVTIKPLYTKQDTAGISDFMDTLPGLAPFTRGPRATMFTHRPWTIRQYSGFSTAVSAEKYLAC